MTQEEKQLLLIDLCARLPHYTMVLMGDGGVEPLVSVNVNTGICNGLKGLPKPYLRPMSSMTEDEKKELHSILNKEMDRTLEKLKSGDCGIDEGKYYFNSDYELDFCLSHHFDYLGLIPMSLALEAKEGMYKTE